MLPFDDAEVVAEEWAELPRSGNTMIPISVRHAAHVLGVAPVGTGTSVAITSLVADSSAVTSGALFVALRGERADGHDFVARARADGASGGAGFTAS